MSKAFPSLFSTLIIIYAATAAWGDPSALFDQLDINGDGEIAAGEVDAKKHVLFQRLVRTADADGDGTLDRDEFVTGTQAKKRERKPVDIQGGKLGPSPGRFENVFRKRDADEDGRVTIDEVPEPQREFFQRALDKLDEDGDGGLTMSQFVEALKQRSGRGPNGRNRPQKIRSGQPGVRTAGLLGALDADHDGQLSSGEIAAASSALMKLDVDGDGRLVRKEMFSRRMQIQAREEERPRGKLMQRLRKADRDQDGRISRDEVPEQLMRVFEKSDGNGDGILDKSEMRRLLKKRNNRNFKPRKRDRQRPMENDFDSP